MKKILMQLFVLFVVIQTSFAHAQECIHSEKTLSEIQIYKLTNSDGSVGLLEVEVCSSYETGQFQSRTTGLTIQNSLTFAAGEKTDLIKAGFKSTGDNVFSGPNGKVLAITESLVWTGTFFANGTVSLSGPSKENQSKLLAISYYQFDSGMMGIKSDLCPGGYRGGESIQEFRNLNGESLHLNQLTCSSLMSIGGVHVIVGYLELSTASKSLKQRIEYGNPSIQYNRTHHNENDRLFFTIDGPLGRYRFNGDVLVRDGGQDLAATFFPTANCGPGFGYCRRPGSLDSLKMLSRIEKNDVRVVEVEAAMLDGNIYELVYLNSNVKDQKNLDYSKEYPKNIVIHKARLLYNPKAKARNSVNPGLVTVELESIPKGDSGTNFIAAIMNQIDRDTRNGGYYSDALKDGYPLNVWPSEWYLQPLNKSQLDSAKKANESYSIKYLNL